MPKMMENKPCHKNELRCKYDFFWVWLGIHKYIYMTQSIHMSVIKYIWVCRKQFPLLNLQYAKTELSYDVDFLHMGRHTYKQ